MSNEVASNHESILESSQNIQETQTLTEEPMTFTQSEIAWDGYFESMAVLMLLLALLWACFWAARRYGLFNMMPRAANIHREALRLEGQLSLGPRKGIMIVRCLEKRLVLGITDQNITLLTELPVEDAEKSATDTTSTSGMTSAAPSVKNPPDNKLIQQFNKLLQGKKTS
ncbi:MAG: flagellar biosynthetic protein FliO [Pseudomonadota bacterium]